ncbi:hypothetical protein EJ06DRAFT_10536 [Trichodelitschia bisporula]|uniref:Uncharacterized protein n=1 Tax=Trichodelitschia bisporula TaxID=703511 RepID=A0A6G1I9T0_9PEZI|nr:hypothetical protein EJ06DRAFT_10536 [Trichodelitschia bisporula]
MIDPVHPFLISHTSRPAEQDDEYGTIFAMEDIAAPPLSHPVETGPAVEPSSNPGSTEDPTSLNLDEDAERELSKSPLSKVIDFGHPMARSAPQSARPAKQDGDDGVTYVEDTAASVQDTAGFGFPLARTASRPARPAKQHDDDGVTYVEDIAASPPEMIDFGAPLARSASRSTRPATRADDDGVTYVDEIAATVLSHLLVPKPAVKPSSDPSYTEDPLALNPDDLEPRRRKVSFNDIPVIYEIPGSPERGHRSKAPPLDGSHEDIPPRQFTARRRTLVANSEGLEELASRGRKAYEAMNRRTTQEASDYVKEDIAVPFPKLDSALLHAYGWTDNPLYALLIETEEPISHAPLLKSPTVAPILKALRLEGLDTTEEARVAIHYIPWEQIGGEWGKLEEPTEAYFINHHCPHVGMIIVANYVPIEFLDPDSDMPALSDWRDFAFFHWMEVTAAYNADPKGLEYVLYKVGYRDETSKAVCRWAQMSAQNLDASHIWAGGWVRYTVEDTEFFTLLGSDFSEDLGMMLIGRKKELGVKVIDSVSIYPGTMAFMMLYQLRNIPENVMESET